jgi:hypothetical protein
MSKLSCNCCTAYLSYPVTDVRHVEAMLCCMSKLSLEYCMTKLSCMCCCCCIVCLDYLQAAVQQAKVILKLLYRMFSYHLPSTLQVYISYPLADACISKLSSGCCTCLSYPIAAVPCPRVLFIFAHIFICLPEQRSGWLVRGSQHNTCSRGGEGDM